MKTDIKKLSDEKLVEWIRDKDQEQYEELMGRYQDKLSRYVGYLLNNGPDTADVVQETLVKAFVNLKSFDVSKKFSAWIYRIAHNEAMNRVKKKKPLSLDFNEWLKEVLPGKVNIEKDYEKQEEKKILRSCLNSLTVKYRSVLSLHYLEDKSYEEISEILRVPIGTVGIRLKRGKEKLKEICNNNGGV